MFLPTGTYGAALTRKFTAYSAKERQTSDASIADLAIAVICAPSQSNEWAK